MDNIMQKIKTTRVLAGVGIVLLILGVFMPYVKYSILGYSYTISLCDYIEGKIVMILAIANLLFIFKDFVEKYVPSLFNTQLGSKIQELNNPKYSLVPTVLIALFAIYLTVECGVSTFSYYNIGFYSLWIGTACLVAYALVYKKDNDNNNI